MIIKDKNPKNYKVNLLCGTGSCNCPDITIRPEEDTVLLTDDHGNENQWTMENFREFVRQSKDGAFDTFL